MSKKVQESVNKKRSLTTQIDDNEFHSHLCEKKRKKNCKNETKCSAESIQNNQANKNGVSEKNPPINKPIITNITLLTNKIKIIRKNKARNQIAHSNSSHSFGPSQDHNDFRRPVEHSSHYDIAKDNVHQSVPLNSASFLQSSDNCSSGNVLHCHHDDDNEINHNDKDANSRNAGNLIKKNPLSSKSHQALREHCHEQVAPQVHLSDHNYFRKKSLSSKNKKSSKQTQLNFRHLHDHMYASQMPSAFTNSYNLNQQDEGPINDNPEHYLGPMNISCIHCGAKHFAAEKVSKKGNSFNDCCSHGKVILPPLPDPPLILKQLFDGTHELSKHYYDRIRYYNNQFSFASFNANLVNFANRRSGPFCFKIQGQIYYQINTSLYPADEELPSYGQLFIVDSMEATNYRLNHSSDLNAEILHAIDQTMRQCNIFAQSYQMMKDEIDLRTAENNGIEPELELLFTLKKGLDKRRFNFQRSNEVAAVFSTTADGEIPQSYVTIRNKNTRVLQYVNAIDPNVEPWTYPLFYPYGTQGWTVNMQTANGTRRITRNAYIKYRMAIRDDINYILMGRRLFQQWTVDNYVKMEQDRMNWLRLNQKQIRADSYEGLLDHLEKRANESESHIGRVVILPSSYQGSPRNMLETYRDAMAIVRKFGKPDLFITMTCNPKWKEIVENLYEGQTSSDRPELVARVFEEKKNELIRVITEEKCFGDVQAFVYVVEYQKRGLPHIHLLLTLKQNSKITTPEIVDKYISAEIPEFSENPELHEIIKGNMIHGPCGNWCLNEKGSCSKNYPKTFKDETTMDEDGYPHYRRRNTGTFTRRDGFVIDNRHVVPHNKMLLQRFNCHINVEAVSSVKAVKYLFKYIYKGHDAAALRIQEPESNQTDRTINYDEISNFIETRYVSPPEACGRILNHNLQGRSHSVMRLPIHLPNQQTVRVDDINNQEAIETALNKRSELTDYFALNIRDPHARNFTYGEIPSHYVFTKAKNETISKWKRRQLHFNTIGRMYAVSPTQTELFHLRLLLISVKGATSYENLRTVNGIVYDNFISACLALGLIEDDDEWKKAMHEAEVWMMPRQLRNLFVRILIHCHPIHPEELWEEFKDALSQDYSRTMNIHQAHRKAYIQISALLNSENSGLASFPSMPQITETEDDDNEILPEEHRKIGMEQYEKLNRKQTEIVDKILNKVSNNDDNELGCFFIDGPGGSGKTFVYTTLYHLLRSQEKKVCTMAYTGIAATLLPCGKTVHKTFKLPIALYSDSSQTIKVQSKEAAYLRSVDMFIWDEAPMAPRHALELVDRNLRDIMNNDTPFGGKIMVLGGDFRQLLPVKENATRCELVNLSIKFSHLWPVFQKLALTENMRTLPEEAEFAQFVLSVGDGTINCNENELDLPDHCVAPSNTDIAEDVYGEAIKNGDFDKIAKWAILSARNVDVDDINKRVVELLDPSTEKVYTSINSLKNCDNGEMTEAILPEYLETLNPPNLPPHELRLRVNAIVMLIRNLSVNEGLCNGTRLQILELSTHLLKCRILTGDKSGQIVFINRITLYSNEKYPFEFGRRQFPVRLAFAMTINKAQGQTFEKIGIDLRRDVFNHGHMYVVLSRVRSWSSIRVYFGEQRENNIVKNYVYAELFS